MQDPSKQRKRAAGTGSLFIRIDKGGRETRYAQWRQDRRIVKRKVGRRRTPNYPNGLTKRQAEKALRKMMEDASVAAPREQVTVEDVGKLVIARVEARGRKKSTVEAYGEILRLHIAPFFGKRAVGQITCRDVESFVSAKLRTGRTPKTVCNYLTFLHQVLDYAVREGWAQSNVTKLVDRPKQRNDDPDIHYLTVEEIEAVLRKVPDDTLGRVERVLYLAAVQTGMRQGELVALRWRDVDWSAQKIRIRRGYVRGEFGAPKSKRSSRSVPLADRLAGELARHHQESPWQQDDNLVFAHPVTGMPLDRSKLIKRFKDALSAAGIRKVRFHDLRHSFGTRMGAVGVPMRTLQEWMGHRDIQTTMIYADYAPSEHEAEWIEAAFAPVNSARDRVPTAAAG